MFVVHCIGVSLSSSPLLAVIQSVSQGKKLLTDMIHSLPIIMGLNDLSLLLFKNTWGNKLSDENSTPY
jgi:hypothetical protein